MGAILGLAGGFVLLLLVAVLFITGAFRPKSQDGPGPSAVVEQQAAPPERVGKLD